MQITTVGHQAMMPECVMNPVKDGSFKLSTVHYPEGDLSFYREISHYRNSTNVVRSIYRECIQYVDNFVTSLGLDIALAEQSHKLLAQPQTIDAADTVNGAKQVTGLSIKDLAPVFEVTRQTLYNFRKDEARISERNWQRLDAVGRVITNLAKIFPSSPGSRCKHFVFEGETLYGLLCSPQLDEYRIERVAKELAKQLAPARHVHDYHSASIDQLTRHG
ncbi:hypothetical protein [Chromohalobacter japonicus]|uniref:hypothetical protein n=1 Tax=Chromohalobacter japonicus TaxID=223900 RepID=UPI00058ED58B|nr:hypothetical protein [Chromohalobacter japonicus]